MTPARLLPDMDPDEREFVREVSSQIETLAARMAACPPFDRALASREGVLPEPEQTTVSAHVRTCAVCQALLRDALESELDMSDADLARGRAQLPSGEPPRGARDVRWSSMLALAASIAAVVASTLWALSLRQENRSLREAAATSGADVSRQLAAARTRTQALEGEVARLQPSVALNIPLIDLEPTDALRSGTPSAVPVPSSAPLVTLVLAISGTPARAGYALEIRDSMDRVIWSGGGLEATSSGTVTLAVPRALLPTGTLALRLTAPGGAVVHRYTVRIVDLP
jgi:hypothetical protein